MGRKLAYTVHVRDVDGDELVQEETFPAGAELPAWAAKIVGDHVDGTDDEPAPVAPNGAADHMLPPQEPGGPARDPDAKKSAPEAKAPAKAPAKTAAK